MSGKGSNPRPFEVPREDYEASFDRIFGKRERKPWTPPPLPDDAALADLAEAFERVDREDKHYLCNGKGWLYAPTGELCGHCPECPRELRMLNEPPEVTALALRAANALAAPFDRDFNDLPCSPNCAICEMDKLGEPPCPTD